MFQMMLPRQLGRLCQQQPLLRYGSKKVDQLAHIDELVADIEDITVGPKMKILGYDVGPFR